jgi:DNA-binding HxlR family transcriptional regulator
MSTYGQFCPVARASEILAERWTPLVVRELLCGSRRFSELQRGVPLMSKSLLAERLKSLERAGILRSEPLANGRGHEYRLTDAGEELRPVVEGLGAWGWKWVKRSLAPEELDSGLLVLDMGRSFVADRLPAKRVVVRIDFTGIPRGRPARRAWWLKVERPEVEVCTEPPSPEVQLEIDADVEALTRFWLGHASLSHGVRTGRIVLRGPRPLADAFPRWFGVDGPDALRPNWARAVASRISAPESAMAK